MGPISTQLLRPPPEHISSLFVWSMVYSAGVRGYHFLLHKCKRLLVTASIQIGTGKNFLKLQWSSLCLMFFIKENKERWSWLSELQRNLEGCNLPSGQWELVNSMLNLNNQLTSSKAVIVESGGTRATVRSWPSGNHA